MIVPAVCVITVFHAMAEDFKTIRASTQNHRFLVVERISPSHYRFL